MEANSIKAAKAMEKRCTDVEMPEIYKAILMVLPRFHLHAVRVLYGTLAMEPIYSHP